MLVPWWYLASNWTPCAFSQSWSVYEIGGFYRNRSTVVKQREIVHSVSVQRSILFLYRARTLSRFIFEHLNFHFHPSHLISYLWASCSGNLVPPCQAAFVNCDHRQKSVEAVWNPQHPLGVPTAPNPNLRGKAWFSRILRGTGGGRHGTYRWVSTAPQLDIIKICSVICSLFYMPIN